MRTTIGAAAALAGASIALAGPAAASTTGDVDCDEISYKEAQEILREDPSDPNGLDADDDGEACDANRPEGVAFPPEEASDLNLIDQADARQDAAENAPTGGVSAGGGGTASDADWGPAGLALAGGGVLVAGGLTLRRRVRH